MDNFEVKRIPEGWTDLEFENHHYLWEIFKEHLYKLIPFYRFDDFEENIGNRERFLKCWLCRKPTRSHLVGFPVQGTMGAYIAARMCHNCFTSMQEVGMVIDPNETDEEAANQSTRLEEWRTVMDHGLRETLKSRWDGNIGDEEEA